MGSPPRMRGKLNVMKYLVALNRITPAYAGKTGWVILRARSSADHPRVCGENCLILRFRRKSPRITPAYAGKTMHPAPAKGQQWDHPRVCGENIYCRIEGEDAAGSPPRMRGKPASACLRSSSFRITPAYAGKTLKRSFRNQPFCS